MSSKLSSRHELGDSLLQRLSQQGIVTEEDLLQTSLPHLMISADVDRCEALDILSKVSSKVCPRVVPARTIYASRSRSLAHAFLPSRLRTIDAAMQGGMARGAITEVVGPAGAGKTQLCLMMAAAAGLPEALGGLGEGTGVMYIDTESKFSPQRLLEIARRQAPSWFSEQTCPEGAEVASQRLTQLLDRTLVHRVDTTEALVETLEHIEESLIENRVGLLIVDSIAALARVKFHSAGAERTNALLTQAASIKRVADVFQLVVLITNQVTTQIGEDLAAQQTFITGTSHSLALADMAVPGSGTLAPPPEAQADHEAAGEGPAVVIPALGTSWHHCVSTRLVIEHFPAKRVVTIAKSPIAPQVTAECQVTSAGLVEIEERQKDHLVPEASSWTY